VCTVYSLDTFVSQITYTVLVETLNPAQSNPMGSGYIFWWLGFVLSSQDHGKELSFLASFVWVVPFLSFWPQLSTSFVDLQALHQHRGCNWCVKLAVQTTLKISNAPTCSSAYCLCNSMYFVVIILEMYKFLSSYDWIWNSCASCWQLQWIFEIPLQFLVLCLPLFNKWEEK